MAISHQLSKKNRLSQSPPTYNHCWGLYKSRDGGIRYGNRFVEEIGDLIAYAFLIFVFLDVLGVFK